MKIVMYDPIEAQSAHDAISTAIDRDMLALEKPLIDWRPSPEVILQGLADHFHVDTETALQWLQRMDLNTLEKTI